MMSRNDDTTADAGATWTDAEWLSIEEMARVCCMSTDWILRRIEDEVIDVHWQDGRRLLSSRMVWRVRRIAEIERQFDADPHLAALVTDLIEEVRDLRRHLALRDERP